VVVINSKVFKQWYRGIRIQKTLITLGVLTRIEL